MNDFSIIEEETTVESRLLAIKRSVRRMTQEAFHQSRATNLYFDEDPSDHLASINKDPKRPGIELELFGQETSIIEQHVKTKLLQVESDLQDVLAEFKEGASSAPDPITRSPEQLNQEAALLKTKISFLKCCSQARASLDESTTAATATTSSPDLAAAARQLMAAQQALKDAHATLQDVQYEKYTGRENEISGLGTMEDENKCNFQSSSDSEKQQFVSEANKMLIALQTTARRQKVQLLGRAKTLWHTSVECTSSSLSVRDSKPAGESSDLQAAYAVFQAFGEDGKRELEHILRAFTKTLYESIFAPLLQKHQDGHVVGDWVFEDVEERSRASTVSVVVTTAAKKGPTRRLEWTSGTEDEPTTEISSDKMASIKAWRGTFAFMDRVLSFLVERVFLRQEELCAWAGKRLYGKPEATFPTLNLEILGLESRRVGDDSGLLMEPLMDALTESCVPKALKSNELPLLASMSTELAGSIGSFLESMKNNKLLDDMSESRLAKLAISFDREYINKRRYMILNAARELIIKNDYHNVVAVGVDIPETTECWNRDGMAVFKLNKSGVSETASRLMQLCRETMDESVEQPVMPKESALATLPAALYRTARETLDLFRAILPSTHGYEINHVPRTAAIFHNDCVFLAHHCLTLGLEYQEKYPSTTPDDLKGKLLRQSCMFVDMVPLFRDLAERSLGDMLDLQASQLVELVGQRIPILGNSLRSTDIVTEWSEAETALTAGLYHLRHLMQAWKSVFSADILNRSMWYLCDVVFKLFLDQVLAASDISTSACQFVSALFKRATDELVELCGTTKDSRVFDRFSAVCKFMDMNLNDIQIGLTDGVFQSIAGHELTRLMVATFADNPKRREIINLLAAH